MNIVKYGFEKNSFKVSLTFIDKKTKRLSVLEDGSVLEVGTI